MEWMIRKAVPTDKERIEELFVEMLQTIYNKDDVEGYEEGYLNKFFCSEDWICVAEVDNYVVAYLSIEKHTDSGYIYLDDFSVSKNYRNYGIGTELIRKAEQFAMDSDITEIVLHVEKSNTSALRLYEKNGFTVANDEGNRLRLIKKL